MATLRNLRDLLSLVCLPLLVVILLMWGRSYVVLDRLSYRSHDGMDCRLRSDLGRITYFATTPLFPHKAPSTELNAMPLPRQDLLLQFWESLGFQHEFLVLGQTRHGQPVTRSLTKVPYWFLAGILGIVPTWRYLAWHRRRFAPVPVGTAGTALLAT